LDKLKKNPGAGDDKSYLQFSQQKEESKQEIEAELTLKVENLTNELNKSKEAYADICE
jgi:hypothetical protein